MNTYEENLRDSITASLARLGTQDDTLKHGELQARIGLYHAKGALLAARDRLELDEGRYAARRRRHAAVQRAEQHAHNLLATLTQAKQGSDLATGNVGTAAANLQASADGIMQLASTVGAALNVASAAMYDTELFHQIVRINEHLNQVANQARYLAVQGMEVASQCAESIVGALADQGQDVQARLADLSGKSAADLDDSIGAVHAVRQQLADAQGEQGAAMGAVLDAATRAATMHAVVRGAARYANLGLTVEVVSARRVKISFLPFKEPFPVNHARAGAAAPEVDAYLAIVPQSRADQFTSDQAAQLFAKWDGEAPTFVPVKAGETGVDLERDVYGNPVRPGVPCCAFLYLVPGADYKRHLGNYADHVSIASTAFVPLSPLPRAIYGGPADQPRRLLLAVAAPDQGQGQEPPIADPAAQLSAGAARLEPHLKWLRKKETRHDPAFAQRIDAILPPFASAVQGALGALAANDSRAAEAANSAAQGALAQLEDWQDWVPSDTPAGADFAAIAGLIEELAAQVGLASSAVGARQAGGADNADHSSGNGAELRCLLVDHAIDPSVAACARDGQLPDFLTVAIAGQVAPANYIVAAHLGKEPEGAEPPAALQGKECDWYAVDIEDDDTDNFGNPLVPGHRYTPFVLATTPGPAPGQWASTLSGIDTVWQFA